MVLLDYFYLAQVALVLLSAVLKDELVDLAHAIDEILADQNRELATDF